jgi:hypothetical protein
MSVRPGEEAGMAGEAKPGLSDPIEVSEADIDEAIAVCDGDLRATIRALMVEHIFLERLLAIAQQEASWGYVRGRATGKGRVRGAPA